MNKLIVILRTALSVTLLLILILISILPLGIFLMLPRTWVLSSRLFFWFEYLLCRALLAITFAPFTFRGLEHLPSDPSIIVANHQSALDIPVIAATLRRYPHVWLAVATLMNSPVLRFVLPRVAVLVDMTTPMSGMRTLLEAIKLVNGKRCHIIIFPEGGRYIDGEIHDFFGGFVILAKKMGRPVTPIMIHGLNKVFPPGSWLVYRHRVTIVVGEPFVIQEHEADELFVARVQRWFIDQTEQQGM